MRATKLILDFETRSTAELADIGAWNYARHPDTQITVVGYQLDTQSVATAFDCRELETRRFEESEFLELVNSGIELWAHNAAFERYLWHHLCMPRFGWPEISADRWRCSAALAARWGLPRSLDGATTALGLAHRKDMAGHRLMLQMCKPRRAKSAQVTWWEDEDRMGRLVDYCALDVEAEAALIAALPPLEPEELAAWRWTEKLNEHGILCDRALVTGAIGIAEQIAVEGDREMKALTRGAVASPRQVGELNKWIVRHGVNLDSLDKEHVRDALAREDLPAPARRALELRRDLSRSSVAKYQKILDQMAADDRVRGHVFYSGAHTGRWSGRNIQSQNLVSAKWPDAENLDTVCDAVSTGNLDYFRAVTEGDLDLLSRLLRPALIAPPGKVFAVADFAQIEARVLLWLVGAPQLSAFVEGRDLYCEMAAQIFGRPITKKDVAERDLGKRAVLGCGYGMGPAKFSATCAKYNAPISADLAEVAVRAYREWITAVPKFWYQIERAFVGACAGQALRLPHGMRVIRHGGDLDLMLPSGRPMRYHGAEVRDKETPWGEIRPQVHYWTEDSTTKKWAITSTYGGALTENTVQAIARDLLRDGVLALEREMPDAHAVLTAHDEVVLEINEHAVDMQKVIQILCHSSPWAAGCPVDAEGWTGKRYKK